MATLNKVMLIGRLTDNPEAPRTLPNSGSTVIKFRFAVGRSRKNPQTGQWENDPNPLYIDCEAFHRPDTKRDLVGLIQQYCKKGDPLYIEGRLQLDQWEDKNGGGKRSKHKIVVENIELLGGNRGGDDGGMGGENRASRPPMNTGRGPAPAQRQGGYSPPQESGDEYGGDSNSGGSGEDIPF
jgi:single-strand DNA-binding protein